MSIQELAGGRYRVEKVLGRGGMATVYLARDDELDRPVAIKVLAPHLAGDPTFRDRFVREARLAAQLSHPNVVQIFDAGEDDGSPYIVMECVAGPSLADELGAHGRLSAGRVVALGLQVCAGLEHAHTAGLVHRDIKPGNLLLSDDDTVKIADFGIARAAETTRLTEMGSVLGTAAYLSPEQALGEEVTGAADIYSCGCVLYECLVGRTPYVFETLAELAVKHREEPVPPLREIDPDLSPELEEVVMRSLARNPAYRPPSAAALAQDLAATAPEAVTRPLPRASGARDSDVRTEPLRRGPSHPPRRPRIDRRALLALALLALIVAAIAATVALTSGGGGSNGVPAGPARIEPVSQSGDPGDDARSLADWLRSNSG
ncbi:MAG TPA: protein kinase [Gaiellaceae bacterium]|nr:protein kinase [Gaiellaceae bacterium]